MECETPPRDPRGPDDAQAVPLAMAPTDRDLRIVRLAAGRNMTERLSGMCMGVGSVVQVVARRPGGAVMVEHEGTRYALGRGLAMKVLVVEA